MRAAEYAIVTILAVVLACAVAYEATAAITAAMHQGAAALTQTR